LRGRPATGHRKHLDQMKPIDPTIEVRPGARFVDDGDVITRSGLSAGIDMALPRREPAGQPGARA
jgi:transcriptional regulator GlxA family with amidase domain